MGKFDGQSRKGKTPINEWMYIAKMDNKWTTIIPIYVDYMDEDFVHHHYISRKEDGDYQTLQYRDEQIRSRKWMLRFFEHRCSACGEIKYLEDYGFNYHKHQWDDVCKDCKPIIQRTRMDKVDRNERNNKTIYRRFSGGLYMYKVIGYEEDYAILDTGEKVHKNVIYRPLHSMYVCCTKCGKQITSEKQISFSGRSIGRKTSAVCAFCANDYHCQYYERNKDEINKKRNKIKK